MATREKQAELDLGELTTLPELREVTLPKLSPFRRLQAWAMVAALVWTCAALAIADHLIMRETQYQVEEARAKGRTEAGYVARLLEEKLFEAERLTTTLSLQDSVIHTARALNGRMDGFDLLSEDDRYHRLISDPDARPTNHYFARLAESLDLNQIFLLDKRGTCVASSGWERRDVCIPANYAQRRYFQGAVESGASRQFAVGRQVRIPSFFFSAAIRNDPGMQGGGFQGAVVVRVTSDELTETLLTGGHLTLVTDRYGVVVGSTEKDLLLRHIGQPLAPLPPADKLKSVYGVDRLETIGIAHAEATTPYDLDLWRTGDELDIMVTKAVRGGDLTIVRLIPADKFLDIGGTGWSLAAAAIVVGLLVIVLVERTGDYAARRQAHLAALSGANATLSWVARRLYDLAVSDSLTGTSNRRYFMQRLDEEVGRAERGGRPLSLAMLDIDHFKRVNDTHGHPVGDETIRAVARRCMESVRGYDVVGRIGGEEFAILLPDADRDAAAEVADRIRTWFSGREHRFDGHTVSITCSVGVATLQPGWTAERLLSVADKALYAAKDAGRDRVVIGEV